MNLYFLGFAVLIVTSIALPMDFTALHGNTLNAVVPFAAMICCLWCLELLVLRRVSKFDAYRVSLAVLLFILIAFLSFAVGQYPWFLSPRAPIGAQIAGLGLMVLSGGLFLVAGHRIRHIHHLRWLTWIFLGVGGLFCILQIIPAIGILTRLSSPASVGSIFWICLVAISFSQALFNRDLSWTARALCISITLLSLYRGLFQTTSWVSGWLPPIVAIVVIILFRIPRTLAGIGFLSIPVGFYLAGRIINKLMTGEEYSWITRTEAWRVLWQIFERNPIIGLGPANYYHYTLQFPILGWYVNFSSHNNYIDLLMQTGILGLLAFCWFLFEIIRLILNLLRFKAIGEFERAFLIGVLGSISGAIVSGMLADWIIPFYYNIGLRGFRSSCLFWLFLGGVLALKRIIDQRSAIAAVPLPNAG